MSNLLLTQPLLRRSKISASLFFGLTVVIIFFVAGGMVSYVNTRTLRENAKLVSQTHEVIASLQEVLSLMKDAETGQRGYLLTGSEEYLQPYDMALSKIDAQVAQIQRQTADSPDQQARIPILKDQIAVKFRELALTISLRRTQGLQAALSVVLTDRGKAAMDRIREIVSAMTLDENKLRARHFSETDQAFNTTIWGDALTGLVGIVLSVVIAMLLRRAALIRQRLEWLQAGQTRLNAKMGGEQQLSELGDNVLGFLCEYVGATAGAIYIEDVGRFRRVSTYAVPAGDGTPEFFGSGEGLLGQAVKDARPFIVSDIPPGYLTIGSALGRHRPAHLLVAPAHADGRVNAVLEMGFFHRIDATNTDLLALVGESIGVAVRSAKYRVRLQELLEETQRQAEEVQAQSEELRVSNEELEEQGRALKESKARLEAEQAELAQTNAQLGEQAQILETQKDDLNRSKNELEKQARLVEQASRYKSDFLANMSHELRTPLNSSLILAKLLADNREGTLTAEQVKYAQTIQSAGNDLLLLINDVLDLSKIEAGHMEVKPEEFAVAALIQNLTQIFEPLARQKGLTLKANAVPGAPNSLVTDSQRLEQVLKNLLSNALKFTAKGEITLEISRAVDGRVAFAVRDSGIGIASEKQQMIFEPFRQADGTTSRKYGGTGLGLSISRELVRLLGGEIHLASEVDRGSTFTVLLPEMYRDSNESERATTQKRPQDIVHSVERITPGLASENGGSRPPIREKSSSVSRRILDDREKLTGNGRVILIVEDDESFARIVYDLAHEMAFQCLIAMSAEEALIVAQQYLPAAVVLDVGLPDNSGLFVLERLKSNPRTRHIPVHVVSGTDYTEMARSLGAVGYMLKPVKREQLAAAFQALETRLTQKLRRVLVVEDDQVQLESLQRLLQSRKVETVGVQTAAECLDKLKSATFDCMVLDLTLPGASGFSLLETLSAEDAYSFPPVIVYTGQELTQAEEQKLRKYSKSIIIKGAKSPERLLDEVTLFLHQVVSDLPAEQQQMLSKARSREEAFVGRRILIVEDDVRNIFALTSLLEPRGAKLEIARNGREAINLLEATDQSKSIDLVLMDIMMPEMDGITAMREIRKLPKWKKLPIIALTAKAMKQDQENAFEAGANDFLAKPLDVEKLISLIRVWLSR